MTDQATRSAVVAAAGELFAAHGFRGTTVAMVARRAGVSSRVVRRVVGGPSDLLAAALEDATDSTAAALIGRAAAAPGVGPPLSVLLEAAHEVFRAPRASWDALELEVLARAGEDEELRDVAAMRLAARSANTASVVAASRSAGGIDAALADDAVVHMAMALSIGLATLDPVAPHRPTVQQWDALMARIGAAIAPEELQLAPDYESSASWRIRVDVSDRPGAMAQLARALGALHVLAVGMVVVGAVDGTRTTDLALVAPPDVTEDAILAAARSVGANAHITAGSSSTEGDLPTRMLDAATYLVKHPDAAPIVAAGLVEADRVEVIDATAGVDDSADVLRLQWTADRHVLLHRDWAPFALAERSRASALLRLSAAIARRTGDDDASGWIDQVRGGTVWIRLARPEDAQGVAAMHDRCSERTRYQRYFSLADWQEIQLRRLTGGHRGASLVAMSRAGDIVALGNVFPEADGDAGTGEIALIVDDDHQGTGVGTALLHRLLQMAQRIGFTQVVAHVLAENTGMQHLLGATGLIWASRVESGVAHMTAELPVTVGSNTPEGAASEKPAPRR